MEILKGKLFVISGPSGVGKGTVIKALKKNFPDFFYPISSTTRNKRPDEKEGEVYHFITKKDFLKGIVQKDFLEWAEVHQSNYYGTLKKPIIDALAEGKTVIREVDVQGFHSIKKIIPSKNLVSIFLKAENTEKLLERIHKRGTLPPEEMRNRMESAKKELSEADIFDYQVWSLEGKIPECVNEISEIIKKETKYIPA